MKIPHVESEAHAPSHATVLGPANGAESAPGSPFRLSPPDPRPEAFRLRPVFEDPAKLPTPGTGTVDHEPPSSFELIEDDAGAEAGAVVSPEVERGLRELAEFQGDQRPYSLADASARGRHSWFGRGGVAAPTGWPPASRP